MFGMIVDLFLIDTILDDGNADGLDEIDSSDDLIDDTDSEIEDDEDTGNLLVLFFLGGSDIDEPYTDLASILTLLQFLDYFEVDGEEGEEDD